jgi:hypothetical protein
MDQCADKINDEPSKLLTLYLSAEKSFSSKVAKLKMNLLSELSKCGYYGPPKGVGRQFWSDIEGKYTNPRTKSGGEPCNYLYATRDYNNIVDFMPRFVRTVTKLTGLEDKCPKDYKVRNGGCEPCSDDRTTDGRHDRCGPNTRCKGDPESEGYDPTTTAAPTTTEGPCQDKCKPWTLHNTCGFEYAIGKPDSCASSQAAKSASTKNKYDSEEKTETTASANDSYDSEEKTETTASANDSYDSEEKTEDDVSASEPKVVKVKNPNVNKEAVNRSVESLGDAVQTTESTKELSEEEENKLKKAVEHVHSLRDLIDLLQSKAGKEVLDIVGVKHINGLIAAIDRSKDGSAAPEGETNLSKKSVAIIFNAAKLSTEAAEASLDSLKSELENLPENIRSGEETIEPAAGQHQGASSPVGAIFALIITAIGSFYLV